MPFLTGSFHRSIMTVPDHTEPPEAPSPGFRGNPVEPDFSDRLGPGRRDNAGKALTTSREASRELSLSSSWMEDHRRTQARKARNYLLSSVMTLGSVTNVAYINTVCLWDISRQSWVGAKWGPNYHPNCDPRVRHHLWLSFSAYILRGAGPYFVQSTCKKEGTVP